jgi:L-lactate dehydrogenase complex protein LldG
MNPDELERDIEKARKMIRKDMKRYINMLVESLKNNGADVVISKSPLNEVSKLETLTEDSMNEAENIVITIADSVAADTGVIFFTGLDEGSVTGLAEHHITIVDKDAIMPDILFAFKLALWKSMKKEHGVVFASSSASKTADIEGKVVWGAHGPRKFTVILEGG